MVLAKAHKHISVMSSVCHPDGTSCMKGCLSQASKLMSAHSKSQRNICDFCLRLTTGCPRVVPTFRNQGALKGTISEGDETNPKRMHFRRFSLGFADARVFLENKASGKRRFRRKPQIFAENRRKLSGTRRETADWRFVLQSTRVQSLCAFFLALLLRGGHGCC